MSKELHVVTGAFGFSGKYIARRLLEAGHDVLTLTNSPERENPFKGRVQAHLFNFENPELLAESLRGASVLYNNYWVRFNHQNFTYAQAVKNTLSLLKAAKQAGVGRVVHISITNPSLDSPYEYFRGKAAIEKELKASGMSYCILRPAVLFGGDDILINNIAWFLRRFPLFGVFGRGQYRLEPIYVDDLASLAVLEGQSTDNKTIDAIGPETFTYRELVEEIAKAMGKPRTVISIPAWLGYLTGLVAGKYLGDVTITWDEIKGLMADLLYTGSPPVGKTKLTQWLQENAQTVGMRYSNELKRRTDRKGAYADFEK